MSNKIKQSLILGIVAVSLGGCAPQQGGRTTMGAGLGGLGGAAAGYAIGKGVGGKDGGWIGALAGATAGALIGGAIGNYLDERDQQLANEAAMRALNSPTGSGSSIAWESDHNPGTRGVINVTDVGHDQQGRQCKKTTHTVYSGGKEHVENGVSCQNPSTGAWSRVS
jgi:surface antigen